MNEANKRLDALFHERENALPFNKFADMHEECVDDRDSCGDAQHEESTEVDDLLQKMTQCANSHVASAMETVQRDCADDSAGAVNHLGATVTGNCRPVSIEHSRRDVSQVDTGGRSTGGCSYGGHSFGGRSNDGGRSAWRGGARHDFCGGRGGGGRGQGGGQHNDKPRSCKWSHVCRGPIVNGIDSCDPARWCESWELRQMGPEGRQILDDSPTRAARKEELARRRGQGGFTSRSVASCNVSNVSQDDLTAAASAASAAYENALVRGVAAASQTNNNSGNRKCHAPDDDEDDGTINTRRTFEVPVGRGQHLVAGGCGRGGRGQQLAMVVSTPRNTSINCVAQKTCSNSCTKAEHVGRNESDNNANAMCFGMNWRPLCFAGKVCDVMPHVDGLGVTKDAQIATAATCHVNERTGKRIVVVAHEGLWFGDAVPNTSLNPNQTQAFGVGACDDPADPHRELGMHDPVSDEHVEMSMDGTVCHFE